MPLRLDVGTPAACCGLAKRRDHLVGDRLRTALDRGRGASLASHLVIGSDDDRLDLRPAEIDSATQLCGVLHAVERYRRTH